ncbi:MAG: tyrosine--tRNA ligase [Candidatus Nitrosocosmicus sp.]
MDIEEKISLVQRPPTEEIVTENELRSLFETKTSPKHYIGLEISGKLHLGSLIIPGFKINDFMKAGIQSNVFLADWHTYINNKLNNDWDLIDKISQYYEKAFKFFCPGVNVIFGSDLYKETDDYWKNFIVFSKQITLARTLRSLTIMGRTEKDALDFSQLLYPSMQSVDIKALDLDVVHAGLDQRKIHMLVREVFPKLNWKVPVSVHHHILPGLAEPSRVTTIPTLTTTNNAANDVANIANKNKSVPVTGGGGTSSNYVANTSASSNSDLDTIASINTNPSYDPKDASTTTTPISNKSLTFDASKLESFDDSKIFNKMSKSNPSSSILIHDSQQEIYNKINKAYCPAGISKDNPVLEIIEYIVFHQYPEIVIERPSKYGGDVSYGTFDQIKKDYEFNKIHPKDLKLATSRYLDKIIAPVRDYLYNNIPDFKF